jgi:hypothetical protein
MFKVTSLKTEKIEFEIYVLSGIRNKSMSCKRALQYRFFRHNISLKIGKKQIFVDFQAFTPPNSRETSYLLIF